MGIALKSSINAPAIIITNQIGINEEVVTPFCSNAALKNLVLQTLKATCGLLLLHTS